MGHIKVQQKYSTTKTQETQNFYKKLRTIPFPSQASVTSHTCTSNNHILNIFLLETAIPRPPTMFRSYVATSHTQSLPPAALPLANFFAPKLFGQQSGQICCNVDVGFVYIPRLTAIRWIELHSLSIICVVYSLLNTSVHSYLSRGFKTCKGHYFT